MSSIPAAGSVAPAARTSIADDVSEGIRLCEFVVRMRLRNRMVIDSLTTNDLVDPVKAWLRFARRELLRLSKESRAGSKRAAGLRDFTARRQGSGQAPHDYRAQDSMNLDRRARAGRKIARHLRRKAHSRHYLGVLLALGASDALEEVTRAMHAQRLAPPDRVLVESRMDHLMDLASAIPADSSTT